MSNQLSWSDAISMNIENGRDVTIAFQKGSADRKSTGAADGLSPNQPDDSTSQMCSLKPQQFEKNFHSINVAIERIKEKIASIDEIATTGCQIEKSENADEPINGNSIDTYCEACSANKTKEQTADLQKEVTRLKAELAAKNEKIKSLEMILESNKSATCASCEASFSKTKLETDLQRQVIRLETQLSTSWEQIASLRAMLKFKEDEAEAALNNLKSKYEDENAIVDETMLILRNQLRELKECTAAFSSLRAMFITHCEESAAREDELKHQLAIAEEHRKALSLLLRPVVQQKCSPTKKLGELETTGELSKMRLQPQEAA